MYNTEKHIDSLVRHIQLVQAACLILGKRLIETGEENDGIILIQRGFVHDASKFKGIEAEYLHRGNDVPPDKLKEAIKQHVSTNDHHPEYWGGIEKMPPIAIREMVCDWLARAQEFGTGLMDWVEQKAIKKWNIDKSGNQYKLILEACNLLLKDSFK